MVFKGYDQVEGIDFEDMFSPVSRLEAIRSFLAFACFKDCKGYKMDVKSALLNGNIEKEAYIEQPDGGRNCMVSNKLLGLGLKDLTNIYNNKATKEDPLIVISILKLIINI